MEHMGTIDWNFLKATTSHHFCCQEWLPQKRTVDKSQCTCRQGQPNWYETKLPCARMWYLLYVDWSLTRFFWPLNEFVLWLLTYLIVWCSKIWHREYGEQQFKGFFWKNVIVEKLSIGSVYPCNTPSIGIFPSETFCRRLGCLVFT